MTEPLSKRRLKLWIRMLRVTRLAEAELREFLRVEHQSTLPRFDVMAALHRANDALTMSELSRMLLVSNGNTTTVVDRLEKDGLVARTPSSADRRIVHVALTDDGRRHFEQLAADHEARVDELFAGVSAADLDALTELLQHMTPSTQRLSPAHPPSNGTLPRTAHSLERQGPQRMTSMADLRPQHFLWTVDGGVATVRLDRPERKNPLTFESYAELRDMFRALAYADDVHVVVFAPNGGNFCSGGDVHEIIGPLVGMDMKRLLEFTRMTGDMVKAMIGCGKPIISAVDGVCVGAGAIIAMASDLRIATPEASTAFLFTRVGLAGCDMGACAMLPRIIGQGRAAELLYTGRSMSAAEGERWGFYNSLHAADQLEAQAQALARRLADGPTFAHGITKTQLNQEWNMGLEQAIESEAQAQAICMQTADFERAYRAFVAREKPAFEGD